MNKKTIRIAGWALALSMAVAGIGAAIGTSAVVRGESPIMVKASTETVSKTIATYASANSWTNGTAYSTVVLDSSITLTGKTNGNNSKYYTTNSSWRHYEGDSGTVTITATSATLTSVVFTYSSGNSGVLEYGGVNKASGATISLGGAESAVFSVGHSSGNKSGNVQITAVSVTYETGATKHTVTFDSDGGSESPEDINVVDGETFLFPSPGTKAGYTFDGWSSDGGSHKYGVGDESPEIGVPTDYVAYWTEDAVNSVEVSLGTFKKSYKSGDAWDWEHLLVAFGTVGGNSGTATGMTASDFSFDPVAPAPGVTSVTVVATFHEVASEPFLIDGIAVVNSATYTITGTNSSPVVTPSGNNIAGVSASWSNEYTGGNIGQDTAGKSQTLSLTGFSKHTIVTGIILHMHSNASAGAGTLSYSLDGGEATYLVGSAGSGAGFNTWGDNGSYGNNWRDVAISTSLNLTVTTSFSLTISATVNSLFCDAFTLVYGYAPATVHANKTAVSLPADGTSTTSVTLSTINLDGDVSYVATSMHPLVVPQANLAVAGNTLTITAGETAGENATIEVYATNGEVNTAPIEITVSLTALEWNLIDLEITTATTDTVFKVGDTFTAANMVVTATFDHAPTTVTYSNALGNLGDLDFSINSSPLILGSSILDSSGNKTVDISLEIGNGQYFCHYNIVVNDPVYYTKATSMAQLFDGQKLFIADTEGTKIAGAYGGGNNLPAVAVDFDNANSRIDIDNRSTGAIITLGRIKVGNDTVYTLHDGTNYLYAAGLATTKQNYLKGKAELDESCYWNISITAGVLSVVSVNNSYVPHMQFNTENNCFACYNTESQAPVDFYIANTDDSGEAAADAFEENYMHMDSSTGGQCETYYPVAKKVWNAMLEDDKLAFSVNHAAAYARLAKWAEYHGDELNGDMDLVEKANGVFFAMSNTDKILPLVITAAVLGSAAVAGFFLFQRKRKEF